MKKLNRTETVPLTHIVAPRKAALAAALSGSPATAVVADLAPGGRLVGITKGQFSLLDLVTALLQKTGIAALTVCAWTTGDDEIESVARLAQGGRVTAFRLLIDRSFVARRPESAHALERRIGRDAIRQTKAHAKFALIHAGEWRVVVRGSMNFNRNPRLEQFDIDDDPAIYAFFDRVVSDLFASIPPGFGVADTIVSRSLAALRMDDDRATNRGMTQEEQALNASVGDSRQAMADLLEMLADG